MSELIHVVHPELQSQIKIWRSKALDGTITIDDMKAAIIALKQGRRSAAQASESSGKSPRKKAPQRSVDDMLGELGSL